MEEWREIQMYNSFSKSRLRFCDMAFQPAKERQQFLSGQHQQASQNLFNIYVISVSFLSPLNSKWSQFGPAGRASARVPFSAMMLPAPLRLHNNFNNLLFRDDFGFVMVSAAALQASLAGLDLETRTRQRQRRKHEALLLYSSLLICVPVISGFVN